METVDHIYLHLKIKIRLSRNCFIYLSVLVSSISLNTSFSIVILGNLSKSRAIDTFIIWFYMEWNTHVENKTIVGNLNTWSEEIRYISKHLVYKFFVA